MNEDYSPQRHREHREKCKASRVRIGFLLCVFFVSVVNNPRYGWAMGVELEVNAAEQTPHIQRLCRHLSERSPQPMVAVEGTTHVVSYVNPVGSNYSARLQLPRRAGLATPCPSARSGH
jgi:hypothetical protein